MTRHGWLQSSPEIPAADAVRAPYRELLDAAPFLGHVDVGVDPDGCIRRIPMLIRHGDRVYPSMGLLVSMLEPGDSTLPALHWTGHGFSVTGRTGVKRMIPTDRDGYTTIVFAGDRGAFRRSYSMIDVLQWYRAGERDRLTNAFRGRIVLVGNTAMGEAGTDLGTTPFSPVTPLIYVHANSIDAILKSSYLHQPSKALVPAILGALSLLFGWLFVVLSVPAALLVMTLSVLIIGAIQQTLFVFFKMSTPSSIALFLPPAAYLAIASYRYVFLERRTREREKELAVARDIQRRLLPSEPPRRDGLDIFGANIPAQEVGGDYYDWIPMRDGSLVVVIGDVSGKGVSAALLMSNLQALCHAQTHDGSTPGSILEALNIALYRSTDPMRYATMFLAMIVQGTNEILYANGGHNPGLLVRDGRIDTLGTTGLPAGLFEDGGYREARALFLPGDLLVLYSDGITECARKDVFYGEERLQGLVLALAGSSRSAAEIGQLILDDVLLFSRDERYADDITLVVVRRVATPAGQGGAA